MREEDKLDGEISEGEDAGLERARKRGKDV